MTIYHIDKYYDGNNKLGYYISPYNFKGTVKLYLSKMWIGNGRTTRNIKGLFDFLKMSSFNETKLSKKMDKLEEDE